MPLLPQNAIKTQIKNFYMKVEVRKLIWSEHVNPFIICVLNQISNVLGIKGVIFGQLLGQE